MLLLCLLKLCSEIFCSQLPLPPPPSPSSPFPLSWSHLPHIQRVIEVCKRYLPQLSCGFSDPRVQVHIQDGQEFIAKNKQKFDVIITDSPDTFLDDGNERERVGVYVVESTITQIIFLRFSRFLLLSTIL